MTLLDRELS